MKLIFLQDYVGRYAGTMSISSVLKNNGHDCDVFIECLERDMVGQALNAKPDLIGFYCSTGVQNWIEKTAKKLKAMSDIPIIVGGPHPTFFPEFIETENIDMICIGDGEEAALELADKIEKGEAITDIANIWIKRNGEIYKNKPRPFLQDLSRLPISDYHIYDKYKLIKNWGTMPFMFTRGCIFSCSYCFGCSMQKVYDTDKKYHRVCEVERGIKELEYIKDNYKVKFIHFGDAIFGIKKEWLREFSSKYKERIGIPYNAFVEASLLDEESAKLLAESGCYCAMFGIETGNEELRATVLNKKVKNNDIVRAADYISKAGIKLRTSSLFGIPSETVDNSLETYELNIKVKADYPAGRMLQPFPKTKIFDFAVAQGFIDNGFSFDKIDPTSFFDTPMNIENEKEISNLNRLFTLAVKFPFLVPLIKKLAKIPNNIIFEFIHRISILYVHIKTYRTNLFKALIVGWISLKRRKNI